MAIDPKARYQTAAELEESLKPSLSDTGATALAELVALVERDLSGPRHISSGPLLEVAATTLTSSGPASSGDTATVADSVAPKR